MLRKIRRKEREKCQFVTRGELLRLDVVQKVVLDGLVSGGRGESEEEDGGILPIGEVKVVEGAA